MLREILTNKLLYAGLDEPDMVKPPFVYAAGMLRLTGTPGGRRAAGVWRLDQMGQVPFHPPNVSGWEGGTAWLSTSSIRARFDAATAVLAKTIEDGSISRTPDAPRRPSRRRSPPPAARAWAPRTAERAAPLRRARRWRAAPREWEVDHYFPERQRVLRHLLLAGPDAQVC